MAKKDKAVVDECYPEFVRVWTTAYPDLGFNAVSGRKIKELIKLTKWRLNVGGKEATIQATVAAFEYVIAYVKRVGHFANGKPITTFTQQYLSIVLEIKNGKQPTTKKQSARDYIDDRLKGFRSR